VLVAAGVWGWWDGPGPLETVALVTIPANELVKPFHERMPAVLEAGQFGAWLGGKLSDALALLKPYPVELMESWPVSNAVNSVKNDGPELLAPVTRTHRPAQPPLFAAALRPAGARSRLARETPCPPRQIIG
jgi:putative SOS response-associated peptidase YedK